MSAHRIERAARREARRKRAEVKRNLADEALIEQMTAHHEADLAQAHNERMVAENHYHHMEQEWASRAS